MSQLVKSAYLDQLALPEQSAQRTLAVHLHLFYPDMISKLTEYLSAIPQPFDMFISIPETIDCDEEQVRQTFADMPRTGRVTVLRTPNRGRDIAPMVCSFAADLKHYDCFLHLHTKKSPHLGNDNVWCDFLMQHLLHSEDDVRKILALLQGKVGLVAPPPVHQTDATGWLGNLSNSQALADRCGLQVCLKDSYPVIAFPQGSMFFATYDYLSDLFEAGLQYEDFPQEPIAPDGTLAHAVERLMYVFGAHRHQEAREVYISTAELPGLAMMKEAVSRLMALGQKNDKHMHQFQRMLRVSIGLAIALIALMVLLFVKG